MLITIGIQVGIIRVAEVNIGNAVRDQSDSAAAERNLQKQWTRKLAAARKKLEEIHDAGLLLSVSCLSGRISHNDLHGTTWLKKCQS